MPHAFAGKSAAAGANHTILLLTCNSHHHDVLNVEAYSKAHLTFEL